MSKVAFTFDPFDLVGIEPPKDKAARAEARAEIADFILEAVLSRVGDGQSPVHGGKWKRSLSPAYRERKLEESGVGFANLELHGDMLDALECVPVAGGKLELRIRGAQAAKADGHNNHSGNSTLPPREFIPKEGQTFKKDILAGVREIAMEFMEDDDA